MRERGEGEGSAGRTPKPTTMPARSLALSSLAAAAFDRSSLSLYSSFLFYAIKVRPCCTPWRVRSQVDVGPCARARGEGERVGAERRHHREKDGE